MAATGAATARTRTATRTTVPIFKPSGKGYVLVWGKDLGSCMPLIAGEAFNKAIDVINNALRAYHPNPKG